MSVFEDENVSQGRYTRIALLHLRVHEHLTCHKQLALVVEMCVV